MRGAAREVWPCWYASAPKCARRRLARRCPRESARACSWGRLFSGNVALPAAIGCSWYCGTDRTFDDEVILVQHQRTKHFQCPTCHKKLTTATALKTHCLYVHKEEIHKVPNAKEGRDNFDFDIVGMDGVEAAEEALLDPSKRQKTGPAAAAPIAPPPHFVPGGGVGGAAQAAQMAQALAAQMGIPQPAAPYGGVPGMPGVSAPPGAALELKPPDSATVPPVRPDPACIVNAPLLPAGLSSFSIPVSVCWTSLFHPSSWTPEEQKRHDRDTDETQRSSCSTR